MKHIYFIITVLITTTLAAQVPSGYYSSATGTGFTLKTQLKEIIDNSDDGLTNEYLALDLGYSALYDTFQNSDVDLYYENNGTLLDMYSERVIQNPDNTNTNLPDAYEYTYGVNQDDGTLGTAEGQRYNREHTIPQSSFNSGSPMRNDAHFVIPSDKYVNAQRGNLPYGIVNTSLQHDEYSNGSLRGENINSGVVAGYSGDVFEPIDEFKGDIARLYFFFVTRYEDQMTGFNYVMFDGSASQAIDQPFLDMLYDWHVNDPVSQRELDRNNAIFAQQNNRNPFIDNPQFVFDIWQSTLSVNEIEALEAVKMYPNPANGNEVTIESNYDLNVEVYDVLGKKITIQKITSNQKKLNISTLSRGVYLVKLNSENGSIIKKLIKQ
ncbi:endonuclease [Psychroserpens algicola]|uniref:Endonuclease n=1 Tax=Psychroserpens algicola TaxID=1719034 RepID=A0ABT0H507_9FLAO|nr:endonuclease [Psychroserpens algicola]MCK8479473.1 endonuclease [Psychroserpens algicola]